MSDYDRASRELGARVRDLRTRRGWSQEDLAAKLTDAGRTMSQPVVGRIEAGSRVTGVGDLAALARVFGTTTSDLLESVDVALGIRPLSSEATTVLDEATLDLIADQVAARIAAAIIRETA